MWLLFWRYFLTILHNFKTYDRIYKIKFIFNMKPNQLKESSDFFADQTKFQIFNKQSTWHGPRDINELELICCGYGFFQESKRSMIQNFINYLGAAVDANRRTLKFLKVIFNGFSVKDQIIPRIIKSISMAFASDKPNQSHFLKTLHFHTTNLKNCRTEDLNITLKLFSRFSNINCEQISIQLSDWQFQGGKQPNAVDLQTILTKNFGQPLYYKKFRLQMSSWYSNEIKAFRFLQNILSNQDIAEKLVLKQRNQDNEQNQKKLGVSNLTSDQIAQSSQFICVQATEISSKFTQEREKDKLVGEKKKLRKQKMEEELELGHAKDKQSEQAVKEKIKRTEAEIQRIDLNIKDQQDSILKIRQSIENRQTQLNQTILQNSVESIARVKIEEFHRRMKDFIEMLLESLVETCEQFEIDFRNWHPSFDLGRLKKALDVKVGPKAQFSMMQKGIPKLIKQVNTGLKTVYMM